MPFDSLDYFLFLAIGLAGWWALARRADARFILIFLLSCLFYAAGKPWHLIFLLGTGLLDYAVGRQIHAAETPKQKRAWLTVSLVCNLGLLATFKYWDFVATAITDGFALADVAVDMPYLDVLPPIGISFYTFQSLSYSIDVYRGHIEPSRKPLEFAAFITFFPQLVSGPIVRASELLPQIAKRPELRSERVGRALFLIATGLVKKIAIANHLSVNLVDRVFENPELYTAPEVVIALYAFTMQIYCDFSGYTDVARGSAMLFGFELPENFDRPYQATSPAEFWRRWHMTLSRWLRDYLYFPLGGSRGSPGRTYFNLFLTIFLIGIWHGAGWTFVVYATLQGTAMVVHRFVSKAFGRPRDAVDSLGIRALKIVACLQFVVFSRILFRATSIENAGDVTERLFSGTTSMAQVSTGVWLLLVLAFGAHYLPRRLFTRIEETFVRMPAPAQGAVLAAVAAILALVATDQVVPYIYEQF